MLCPFQNLANLVLLRPADLEALTFDVGQSAL
jgi:hypothetical protein